VTIIELQAEAGEQTAAGIRAGWRSARVIAADVSNTESMRVAFDQVERLDC